MPLLAYAIVLLVPPTAAFTMTNYGVSPWLLAAAVWVGVPFFDALVKGTRWNYSPDEERARRENRGFDLLLYLAVPSHLFSVLWFAAHAAQFPPLDLVGAIVFNGTACGVLAINVGHELGHRPRRFEQRLAKLLLASTLYSHFFVEHNRGHHARVATPADPASARRGEMLYTFWGRSLVGSLLDAWSLAPREVARWKGVELGILTLVGLAFGPVGLAAFVASAIVGILLLETVNYVEHYGLSRAQVERRPMAGSVTVSLELELEPPRAALYERVSPAHSWTSDHPIGRAILFDLPRHADHHAHPARPFQVLRHMEDAPELPTGYAGMVVLALCPPLFFRVMDPRVEAEGVRLARDHEAEVVHLPATFRTTAGKSPGWKARSGEPGVGPLPASSGRRLRGW